MHYNLCILQFNIYIHNWHVLAVVALTGGKSYLDAIELGCTAAEQNESITSVGYGGR